MSSRSKTFTYVAFVVVLVLGLSLTALADSRVRIVRLSYVDGDVDLDRRDGRGFTTAFLNMPVVHGARLQTQSDSRAEIEMEDGSTIRLTPQSIVEFTDLGLRSNGGKITMVDLIEGTAYFNLRHEDENDFRLIVDGQHFTLRRSSHFRVRAGGGFGVDLAVFKGEVEVLSRNGQRVEVRKGESLTFDPDDPTRYFLARSTAEDRYDNWDRERQKYRDREVQYARAYRDGYRAGFYDLDHYGGWFSVAGYGRLWRPFRVSLHWDPFGDGAWVYYPGYGYMWVSYYPWGWTPYRYGSWVHVSNYGWCWRPGNRWNSWSPITVVVNAPSGYRYPTQPTVVVNNNNTVVVPVGRGGRTGRDLPGMDGSLNGKTIVTETDDGFSRNRRPARSIDEGATTGTTTGTGAAVSADTGVSTQRSHRPSRTVETEPGAADVPAQRAVGESTGGERASRPSRETGSPTPGNTTRVDRSMPVIESSPSTPPPSRMERPSRGSDTPPVERAPSRSTETAPMYRPERTHRPDPPARVETQRSHTPQPSYSPPPQSAPAPAPAPRSEPARPTRTSNPN